MRSLLWNSLALVAALGAARCTDLGLTCTEIGCSTGALLSVQPSGGALPPGTYTISANGYTTITCTLPADAASGSCSSASEVASISATNGIQVFMLSSANPAPRSVELVVQRGSTEVARRTLQPDYKPLYPNGEECGAACEQAQLNVTLD